MKDMKNMFDMKKKELYDVPDSILRQIEYVLNDFNKIKINKVMEHLDWQWYGTGVPSIYELIKHSEYLLLRSYWLCFKSEDKSIPQCYASGGFKATCFHEDNKFWFELEFILTSNDNYI